MSDPMSPQSIVQAFCRCHGSALIAVLFGIVVGLRSASAAPPYPYDISDETMSSTVEFSVTDFVPIWAPDNTYTPLTTYNGNTYFVWVDSDAHPWVTQISDSGVTSERLDDGDDYQVVADGHYQFSIGVDSDGYLHVMGGMHTHTTSTVDNLPTRYLGSSIMYWVSDDPEDISSFTFVGNDANRSPPGHGFGYCSFANDMNMELYMTCRIRVHHGGHVAGEMGKAIYRYNTQSQSWTALGGLPPSWPTAVYPCVLWEDNGHAGGGGGWYQGFANIIKIDQFNRLHFAATINNDSTNPESTHVVYAYSDDGGTTFRRANGTTISGLPMRVDSGANQADLVEGPITNAGLAGNVFYDGDQIPAVSYKPNYSTPGVFRYWVPASNAWSSSVASPAGGQIRVLHHLDPNGVLTFVTSSQDAKLVRASDFTLSQTKTYNLAQGGLTYLSGLDQLALRHQGVYRFVARRHDNSSLSVVRAEFTNTGSITEEVWNGITGGSLDDLADDPDFPTNPDGINLITGGLERPTNTADSYGRRLRGFLHVPADGDYTFYIAGDDRSELWLSTDATISNARRIAYHLWWTDVYQWNKYSSQQSQAIPLVGGRRYYIEVVHKEGAGGDHVEVAWDGPGLNGPVVIDDSYLSPWAGGRVGAFGR